MVLLINYNEIVDWIVKMDKSKEVINVTSIEQAKEYLKKKKEKGFCFDVCDYVTGQVLFTEKDI